MSDKTKIEWADASWNPIRGCTKVSAGCKNCYAETFLERFRGVPGHPFENGFDLQLVPGKLEDPIRWKRPRKIFVNSLSDLFHVGVPVDYIDKVVDVMRRADHHTFQLLTKRPMRMSHYFKVNPPPKNLWVGVSVENQETVSRIDFLREFSPTVRFVSFEPLIGDVGVLDLTGIHWAIVGGESGPKARPVSPEWVIRIKEQCEASGTAFFFKQWGGTNKRKAGRTLNGETYSSFPEVK